MAEYKHGTYGEFAESIVEASVQAATVPVYVGVAPVNLIRNFQSAVNSPIKLTDFDSVKRLIGYSSDWNSFDLCEAFYLHFDNESGNVGPIVAINVLNPAVHKKAQATTKTLAFANGRATIESDTIILDTLVLADKVEGTDFSISYDFGKKLVVIESIGNTCITGSVQATYSEVDPASVTPETIIGGASAAGVYSGLGCVKLVYPELNLIPNLIICPKWGCAPAVYKAMVKAGTAINGHWDAFIYSDIPVYDGAAVDTIELAKAWQTTNGYTSERSKVFWPQAKDTAGHVFHASVLATWRTLLVDASHNGVPMESPSNKSLPICKQYFGDSSVNRGFDQQQGNELNAAGITTVVFWGGLWVLWGPHTAAYKHDSVTDKRVIFDNSIRMMMYITNSFQAEHALKIDSPMTRAQADTIKNREQEKADALAAIGALIGTPVVEFKESENSTAEIAEGNFVWGFKGTPTPPFKSGTLRVAYTTAGFDSYFGEVE
ncbi:MAG: phage tail sheath family protein [Clostridiales bacterium]|nr:phage tail sheath family protein [Clostridiales bacterium]